MEDPSRTPPRAHEKPDVINAPVGSETDVASIALHINSGEINAITISGEPFGERRRRLQELIGEIEGRIDASPRGKDLEPLLEEARTALRLVEERERAEGDRS
ncbi:hypothetical protein [Rhizobium sp. C1]|uniref:hypothetical protein n=1 Tax=Rhizobium sp. C1 TaxID=1349799 RepID=UPI001E40AC17|nr:hypothetical protein [Rhizobium sp. C1]MCD2178119.1 hypothetical protein [Rhizobium sp. C1]